MHILQKISTKIDLRLPQLRLSKEKMFEIMKK